MRSTVWFIVCFAIIYCVDDCLAFRVKRVTREASSVDESVDEILDYVSDHGQNWLGKGQNAVAVLGNAEVGKKSLITLLTDSSSLVSKQKEKHFFLEDKDPILTPTAYAPEAVMDKNIQPRRTYYKFPGFGNEQGLKYDLLLTYFTRQLADQAQRVSFLFLIDYNSMQSGSSTDDFDTLAKYATSIIQDFDKYNDAFALIVTKVDSPTGKLHKHSEKDDEMKLEIADFLKNRKTKLQNSESSVENENIIQFIDSLLEKKQHKYHKIGLFREPDEEGPVEDIELMQDVKHNLLKIIDRVIDGTDISLAEDFGYTITATFMDKVHDLKSNLSIKYDILQDDLIQFYEGKENELADIFDAKRLIQNGYANFSQINEDDSTAREVLDEVIYMIHDLGIGVSGENLNSIKRDFEQLKIIDQVFAVYDLDSLKKHKRMKIPKLSLEKVEDYLIHSSMWYKFLIELYKSLSSYDFQNDNIEDVDVRRSAGRLLSGNKWDKENLEEFLEGIDDGKVLMKKLSKIDGYKLNRVQWEALQDVLEQMMDNNVNEDCYETKLTVMGRFVKISDVVKMECWKDSTDVVVFASDTLFIDKDMNKSGKPTRITFIAPKWIVIGKRTINLNGKNAEDYDDDADDGTQDGNHRDGDDGEPGLNGGPAGHFAGIGGEFIDTENLKMKVNGGNGGNGQDGGNGADGIDADELAVGDYDMFPDVKWKDKGYEVTGMNRPPNDPDPFSKWFRVITRSKNGPGNGGDGGRVGNGGNAGFVKILPFTEKAADDLSKMTVKKSEGNVFRTKRIRSNLMNITLFLLIGERGENNGICGIRGEASIASREYEMSIHHQDGCIFGACTLHNYAWLKKYHPEGKLEAKNGKTGAIPNKEPLEVFDDVDMMPILLDYKDKMLPHMAGSIIESKLKDFYRHLSKNENLIALMDPLNVVKEFLILEKHFFNLRHKLSFEQFYESLLERIDGFETLEEDDDSEKTKQIYNYLYTAVYSKLVALRGNYNSAVVVDLRSYLKDFMKEIKKLDKKTQKNAIIKRRDKFEDDLDAQIKSARGIIETEVLPAIDAFQAEIDKEIEELYEENIERQKQQEADIKIKKKEMLDLQRMQNLKRCLVPFRVFGTVLSFAGPEGAIAGAAIGSIADLAVKMSESPEESSDWKKYASKALATAVDKLSEQYEEKGDLLKDQLKKIKEKFSKMLNKHPKDKHLKAAEDEIDDYLSKMKDSTNKENGMKDQSIRNKIMKFMKKKLGIVKNKEKHDVNYKKKGIGKVFETAKNVVSIVGTAKEMWDAIEEDDDEIQVVADSINELEKDLEILKQHEKLIDTTMVAKMKNIRDDIIDWGLDDESIVENDLQNWKIQNSIRDTKSLFDKLTDGFTVQHDLHESLNKILNGMAFLAEIYDRIDGYSEKKKLVDYIADISIGTKDFEGEIGDAVSELEEVIQSNILFERYEAAMHAFSQHFFPFAHLFFESVDLPKRLQMNDPKSFKRAAIEQIQSIRRIDGLTKSTIGKYHTYLSEERHSLIYTWRYNSIKPEVKKLLRGEQIYLTANIASSELNYDAVKFKTIRIKFVMRNKKIQDKFDEAIRPFGVFMRMIGENYYRCGSRFYSIPLNSKDININYSFDKDKDGPIGQGAVYKQIKENDPFLSPFSMWDIKLEVRRGADLNALKPFANEEIKVQLVGDIQVLKYFPARYCNEFVDKYYHLDKTLTVN